MTDFLDKKRKEIKARLDELRPLVDEFHRLEAAEQALAGVKATPPRSASAASSSRTARKPARAKRSASSTNGAATGRRGRPKGSGQRAQQALELIRNKPGITIPELAEAMEIKQNYLYRVVPDLQEQGLVTKSGRGWHIR